MSTLHRLGLHVWAISSRRLRGLRMPPEQEERKQRILTPALLLSLAGVLGGSGKRASGGV